MTMPSSKAADAARLKAIKRRLDLLDGASWMLAYDGHDVGITAQAPKSKNGHAVPAMILRGLSAATSSDIEFAAFAPADLAFLLALLDRASDEVRRLRAQLGAAKADDRDRAHKRYNSADYLPGEGGGTVKNHAAQAAMLGDDVKFRAFLRKHPSLPDELASGSEGEKDDPADLAAKRMRALLGIKSRAQINTDVGSRERFLTLLRHYETWARAGVYDGWRIPDMAARAPEADKMEAVQ